MEPELRQLLRGKYAKKNLRELDLGWLKLFRDNDYMAQIREHGFFRITPVEIKDGCGLEPRLMSKHDYTSAQPVIFQQEGLSILPLSRREYVVARCSTFHPLPKVKELAPKYVDVPRGIESLDFTDLTSEAVALSAASLAGVFEDFINEGELKQTLAGRMKTTDLNIQLHVGVEDEPPAAMADLLEVAAQSPNVDVALPVRPVAFDVVNAQMEIDAGFEGDSVVVLVEAKNKLPDDFNIRQVYYPYLRFRQQVRKPVRNVYMTYVSGVFTLYEFTFEDDHSMQTIKDGHSRQYILRSKPLTREELQEIASGITPRAARKDVPFPQADIFDRVVRLAEEIQESDEGYIDIATIAATQGFVERQVAYYVDAGRYIGLFNKGSGRLTLTDEGEKIMKTNEPTERHLALSRMILSDEIFNAAYLLGKEPGRQSTANVAALIDEKLGLAESTCHRRAQTVLRWVNWINRMIES
ncbi:hypothetical protein C1Y63_06805 [Corynebacterium sp. 13CS0277]|nr:hypothetical protein C1Y63_06805 [Corynebacterium sp. 13CS0277]